MYQRDDTIAAIATPPGRGGVGVIRISGPAAPEIARRLTGRARLRPRHAYFVPFHDAAGIPIDSGILLYFQAPASFTGEAVVELQGHGGPVVLSLLLERVLSLGARPARAGEFSERAFLNGKLDLAQAEAVADLIDAQTQAQARAAQRSLDGGFSRAAAAVHEDLLALRVFVEAAIDFPDEELDLLSNGQVHARLEKVQTAIDALRCSARQGALLREGATLVLVGRPNAGKSSLLNVLAGDERAIVTEIPGTTRDVLREDLEIDGLPLHVLDTAGIRDTRDPVERQGVERARRAARAADLCLLVVDAADPDQRADQALLSDTFGAAPPPVGLTVLNKIDLLDDPPAATSDAIPISARTGAGLPLLRMRIKALLGYGGDSAGLFSARTRHLDALRRGLSALESARRNLDAGIGLEIVAEDLRQAGDCVGEVTGRVSADELLGEVFSRFCIGK